MAEAEFRMITFIVFAFSVWVFFPLCFLVPKIKRIRIVEQERRDVDVGEWGRNMKNVRMSENSHEMPMLRMEKFGNKRVTRSEGIRQMLWEKNLEEKSGEG